jgi:beta-N-acetylhexosaminidase
MTAGSLRALVVGLLISAATLPTSTATAVVSAPTAWTCATQLLSHWSTPALAREVVVVSVQSTSTATMTQAASDGFGGLLLFGTTVPTNLVTTLHGLSAASPAHLTLAVMTDDEGGGIIRTPSLTGTWPWAQVLGDTMTPAQIEATGRRVGVALMKAGITMDLAPVVDVDGRAVWPSATNPDGLRSFGASPTQDGIDASAFAVGLQSAGVIATAKHFPGLGYSSGNTDDGPAHTLPWSQLAKTGLVPFRSIISSGVNAIMMSNAGVPGLTTLPASLSPVAVSAVRNMGFAGLIVTDALAAGAISSIGLSDAAAGVRAIGAGDDLVLAGLPSTPLAGLVAGQQMAASINAAVVHGELTRATLLAAAAHVVVALTPSVCQSI